MRGNGMIAYHRTHQLMRQANILAQFLFRRPSSLAWPTDGLPFLERDRSVFTNFANRRGKVETKAFKSR